MAIAYEELQGRQTHPLGAEHRYAHAMSTLYRLGELAIEGSWNAAEVEAVTELARKDFGSGLAENLRTDNEFSSRLDIEGIHEFAVRDGKVRAVDGTPMEDIVRRGYETSSAAAKFEERMRAQAIRDQGDVVTACEVDTLRRGELLWTVSACPEEALAADPDFYHSLGYREGLSFIQVYYKSPSGTTVTAGSYSVGASGREAWSRVQARHGVDVPEDTHSDMWILNHGRQFMTPAAAASFATTLRDEYYQEVGQTYRRHSVSEFLEGHKATIGRYFDWYIRPLAEAVYTGQNNVVMQGFAEALLSTDIINSLKLEVQNELRRVANAASVFTPESGRVMESLIRYALVERLREQISGVVTGESVDDGTLLMEQESLGITYAEMHQQLVQSVQIGVRAGRTYGGCSSLELSSKASVEEDGVGSLQEVYGGQTGEEKTKDDDRIPDHICCPKCKKVAPKERVIKESSWRCPNPKCHYEVDVCTGAVLSKPENPQSKPIEATDRQVSGRANLLGSLVLAA